MVVSKLVPQNLMVAPATLSDTSVTLVWDKPVEQKDISGYRVTINDQKTINRTVAQTHVTLTGLKPETDYVIKVSTIRNRNEFMDSAEIVITTRPACKVVDFAKTYQVDTTGKSIETVKLQRAIDELPKNGTLLISSGTVILTGAVDLKSKMTLQIDGTLKGSLNPNDYTYSPAQRGLFDGQVNQDGLILTRYEGWEMYCYRSLINAGYLNSNDRSASSCENITICGKGIVYGGGNELGTAMKRIYADKKKYPKYVSDGIGGRRTRGRLLSFIQCKNVDLTGITVQNPPCWTIHMIYCENVTTHGIHIKSQGVDNGDGWDPDSSHNCMIFDTTFDTGDDCIAVKSGKNPDGNRINIPCTNIRIFDLKMTGGHGMAIGSEESGGVQNVSVSDCLIQNTDAGIELKANVTRGGYIKNFSVQNCMIDSLLVHNVQYNSDGSSVGHFPKFENIRLKNVTITGNVRDVDVAGHQIGNQNKAVELVGFGCRDDTGFINEVHFNHVRLANAKNTFMINKVKNVYLDDVQTVDGQPLLIRMGPEIRNVIVS